VPTHQKSACQNGFTLTEILVVMALVSTAAIFIVAGFQGLLRQNGTLSRQQEERRRAGEALDIFAADIRSARSVIELFPGRLTLWIDDRDSDDVAGALERVTYHFEQPADAQSAPWIRRTFHEDRELLPIAEIQIGADSAPPATQHIVINIAYGSQSDSRWIGTSAALRRDQSVSSR